MKKNLFPVLAMFIALCFSALFSSCQKDEEILSAASPTDNIVIKMSVPSSANGLRSASEYQDIKKGDTIICQRGINIIIWAENSLGEPVTVKWGVNNILNDNPYKLSLPVEPSNPSGDQTSICLPEHGLYRVSFYDKQSEHYEFYLLAQGIPGKIGDQGENEWIFREEVKSFYDYNQKKTKHILFVYYKFMSDNISLGKPFVVLKEHYSNGTLFSEGEIELLRWNFNDKNSSANYNLYYYFTIDLDNINARSSFWTVEYFVKKNNFFYKDYNFTRSSYSDMINPIKFSAK